jgi:hypothetical protein
MSFGRHQAGCRVLLLGMERHEDITKDRNFCFAVVQRVFVDVYDMGCRVRIHGLVGAAHLNGKEGVIEVLQAAGSERAGVYLDHSGTAKPMLIKVSNLEPINPRLQVKLHSGQELEVQLQRGLLIRVQATPLQPPSAGCLHMSDRNVYHLLDGLLWHANMVSGQKLSPFDPSHISQMRGSVDGLKALNTLAADSAPMWNKVLQSLCNWAKSRPADKPPLPFISDLDQHTDAPYWPRTGVSGRFWVCKQNKDGALLIQRGKERNGAIFCVLGINSDFASLNPLGALPFGITATLLPYRGRIIHNNLAHALPEASRYPSESMAKALEHRVASETPLFSLPAVTSHRDGASGRIEHAVTAFALVDSLEASEAH